MLLILIPGYRAKFTDWFVVPEKCAEACIIKQEWCSALYTTVLFVSLVFFVFFFLPSLLLHHISL